jgi:hypothetical protein
MHRFNQWRRERQAKKGTATWGRLPDPPTGRVGTPIKATVEVKITRADGTEEYIGEFPATVTADGNRSN